MPTDNTPIIVGVGQVVDRLDEGIFQGLSPQELASEASRRALADSGAPEQLLSLIDAIAAVRSVGDSVGADARRFMAPFGGSRNLPRSVARRLGCDPRRAVYSLACGDEPQKLTGEFSERIAAGDCRAALLVGAEAIATQRKAQGEGLALDWNEEVEGSLEDRGKGTALLQTRHMSMHGMEMPTSVYPLLDHARRARRGTSREEYAMQMASLLARLSKVAAANAYSMSTAPMSAGEIREVTHRNRMIADPYTKAMVARDWVNQGAALLLTSVGVARELGIPEEKWVYLHGYADVSERGVLEREDLGASAAMKLAYEAAMAAAGVALDDVSYFDIYSCFPIAVFVACEAIGLSPDDPRPLTVTGGLPFFGGPGNNYSMHGIAAMVECLRADPGAFGIVGANGGYLSKHSVGVYSAKPPVEWRACDSAELQDTIDNLPQPVFNHHPDGWGRIETYTVLHGKNGPEKAIVIGRLERSNERFVAMMSNEDPPLLRQMVDSDPLGSRIFVRSLGIGNRFAFSRERIEQLFPQRTPGLSQNYEHCIVERRGRVLEITINRPEVNNALTPMANEELEAIFDDYESDGELWVAIITGAGTRAFCAGNDLKYANSGKPRWMPKTGFGGLTHRVGRAKPVIAAVNGFAMGGGFEIALACDLVVADAAAQFALSEVRVGLVAGAGGLQRLARHIPRKLALEMILTGRRIDVKEARDLGLVNAVALQGRALERARELAERLLECSPTSIRCSLEILNESEQFASTTDAVGHHYAALDKLLRSDDAIEGVKAFAEKRKPQWRNR